MSRPPGRARQRVRQPGQHPRRRHRRHQRRRLPACPRRPARPHHSRRSPPPPPPRIGQKPAFTKHAGAPHCQGGNVILHHRHIPAGADPRLGAEDGRHHRHPSGPAEPRCPSGATTAPASPNRERSLPASGWVTPACLPARYDRHPGGEWGRSAHTCRARRGRPAPAAQFQPGAAGSAAPPPGRTATQRGRHGIDATNTLSAQLRK